MSLYDSRSTGLRSNATSCTVSSPAARSKLPPYGLRSSSIRSCYRTVRGAGQEVAGHREADAAAGRSTRPRAAQQGVRNSNALAEQLHSKLDEAQGEGSAVSLQSSSGSRVHGVKEAVLQRSEGTQTTPTPLQPKSQTSGTWSHHHLHEPQTHVSNTEHRTQPHVGLSATLPPLSGARVPLGGIGTLTVRADVQMSDSSTISLPQSTRPLHIADTSLTFTAPQSHSSPYTRRTGPGVHHSGHAPSLSEQGVVGKEGTKAKLYSTRGTATGVYKSPHITRSTDITGQRPLDEYLPEGSPKLEPVVVHFTHQSSSSLLSDGDAATLQLLLVVSDTRPLLRHRQPLTHHQWPQEAEGVSEFGKSTKAGTGIIHPTGNAPHTLGYTCNCG